MKKFQMEAILEALVNETLEQQPEDPIAFMSEQMQFMASALAGAVGSEPEAEPVQHAWTQWKGPDVEKTLEEKVALAAGVAEEIIKDANELKELFKRKQHPCCYDGFEPSGRMHIAQGLQRAMNTNALTQAGVKFVFWVADYFALMNKKMDGDMKKIQDCGKYMIEIWRACGMDLTNVEFVWASDFINENAEKYWFNVLQIALRNSITRIKRCGQIMGRGESDDLAAAQIFYPCMQCNDVFMLRCDITQLGIDQRKVNMLAREYTSYPDTTGLLDYLKDDKGTVHKPVILSHHMLAALDGNDKMSKSNPDAAIFMEDTEAEVNRKIKKAFCPPGELQQENEVKDPVTGEMTKQVLKNGCMEYINYLVLPKLGKFEVTFKAGGEKTYTDYAEVVADFKSGVLFPSDLKPALMNAVNEMLQPVRDHFTNDETAKDLLEKMKSYMAERAAKAAAETKAKKKGGGGGGKKGGGGGKKGGGGGGGGAAAGPPPILDPEQDSVVTALDIRVGMISNVQNHPESDKLYYEDIDIGGGETKVVCSGLREYMTAEQLAGPCLVVCNLKGRKMAGIASEAMVLAAMSEDGKTVEMLQPPADTPVGERVSFDDMEQGTAATPNQLNKGAGKKALEALLAPGGFKTNGSKQATWRAHTMLTSKGPVVVPTLADSLIK